MSNQSSWKNKHSFEGFNRHVWGFSGDRWKNIHFYSKLRHVTPQIDPPGKMSPVLKNPPGQLITEAFQTMTLYIYRERGRT